MSPAMLAALLLGLAGLAIAIDQGLCPPGWVYGPLSTKCFRLPEAHSRSKNFTDAVKSCADLDANLPTFRDTAQEFPEFQSVVTELMNGEPSSWSYVWVGCEKRLAAGRGAAGADWECPGDSEAELPSPASWSPSHSAGGPEEACLTVFRWPSEAPLGFDDYPCTLTDYIRVVTVCERSACESLTWDGWGPCERSCGFAHQTRQRQGGPDCPVERRVCTENPPCLKGALKQTQPRFLGEIAILPFAFEPEGWLRADGRELRMDDYFELYTLLRSRFGGDGAETFGLPDMYTETMPYFIAVKGRYPVEGGSGAKSTTSNPPTDSPALRAARRRAAAEAAARRTNLHL